MSEDFLWEGRVYELSVEYFHFRLFDGVNRIREGVVFSEVIKKDEEVFHP